MRSLALRGLAMAAFMSLSAAASALAQTAASASRQLPLQPERWAKFTTSKGTWMSLDVSPDGQTIVFDLVGDLYTMPISGGTATRLTNGLAHDALPRFSPDGKTIVFISDRDGNDNVWTISADGQTSKQLTSEVDNSFTSPEYTPDGNYIVVSRAPAIGGLDHLWLYHVKGGKGLELGTNASGGQRMFGPAFGKDSRYIWYAQRNGGWTYNAVLPQWQLYVFDREAGTRTLMTTRYGSAFRPALSPDGKWVVYGTRYEADTGLRIRDLATSEEKWLAYPVQRDEQESYATTDVLPGYSFTPDSKAVVVSYGGEIWRVPIDGTKPSRIPFTANAEVAVGPEVKFHYPVDDSPTFTVKQIRDAVPSPDGRRLAFTSLDRVYVMDLPNGTPRRVTAGSSGEFYPTWSPDGAQIAFVTWNDAEGHIMKVSAAGGTPVKLTRTSAFYQQIAWSPDGRRIVAIRASDRDLKESVDPFIGDGIGAEFVYVPATGGATVTIGPSNGRQKPHFVSDQPDRIYSYGFIADVAPNPVICGFSFGGSWVLQSTRWDNTDLKQHLRVSYKLPWLLGARAADKFNDEPMPRDFSKPENMPAADGCPLAFPVDLLMMAPKGDHAVAIANNQVYDITVARTGAAAPHIVLTQTPDSAAMPIKKLTDIGGEFPAWSADGSKIHWSIGNAFVSYDLTQGDASTSYKPAETRVLLTATRDMPRGTVVLRGARVITAKGNEVIENADIVVKDNRIVAVGPRLASEPAGARVIDVTGKTIMPGIVDVHSHMWPLWGMHWKQNWIYNANLAYGVTTTRDPQTATTDVLTYGDRVESGDIPGPRVYSTGPGVFSSENIRSLDDARNVLRRYSDYYDTKTFKMYLAGNRMQRQWLIMAARELKLMPTTEGGLDYRLNMTHAMDGYPGIEHTMPIWPAYNDVIELFKTSGTTNTPTYVVQYGGPWAENYWFTHWDVAGDKKVNYFMPQEELDMKSRRRMSAASPGPGGWFRDDEYSFPKFAQFSKDMVENGAHVGLGSHGQFQGLGAHWELWSIASGGMKPIDAIRVATIMGANSIGLEKDLGSLEPGKLADLIVLDANPLEDIHNTNKIKFVMKNGRLYEGDTLNEVWPRTLQAADAQWRHFGPSSVKAGINGGAR